jgi:Coenzyme PQQ synthesis protein D (PqqD)
MGSRQTHRVVIVNSAREPLFRRREGVVARRVAGELLLVPLGVRTVDEGRRTAELFVINETGERLWEWLSVPTPVSELARNLMREFEVTPEAALADATAFVASLRELGMLTEVEPVSDDRS